MNEIIFRIMSLPQLWFSSHRGEFAAITIGKDEVLPHANCQILSRVLYVSHGFHFLHAFHTPFTQISRLLQVVTDTKLKETNKMAAEINATAKIPIGHSKLL